MFPGSSTTLSHEDGALELKVSSVPMTMDAESSLTVPELTDQHDASAQVLILELVEVAPDVTSEIGTELAPASLTMELDRPADATTAATVQLTMLEPSTEPEVSMEVTPEEPEEAAQVAVTTEPSATSENLVEGSLASEDHDMGVTSATQEPSIITVATMEPEGRCLAEEIHTHEVSKESVAQSEPHKVKITTDMELNEIEVTPVLQKEAPDVAAEFSSTILMDGTIDHMEDLQVASTEPVVEVKVASSDGPEVQNTQVEEAPMKYMAEVQVLTSETVVEMEGHRVTKEPSEEVPSTTAEEEEVSKSVIEMEVQVLREVSSEVPRDPGAAAEVIAVDLEAEVPAVFTESDTEAQRVTKESTEAPTDVTKVSVLAVVEEAIDHKADVADDSKSVAEVEVHGVSQESTVAPPAILKVLDLAIVEEAVDHEAQVEDNVESVAEMEIQGVSKGPTDSPPDVLKVSGSATVQEAVVNKVEVQDNTSESVLQPRGDTKDPTEEPPNVYKAPGPAVEEAFDHKVERQEDTTESVEQARGVTTEPTEETQNVSKDSDSAVVGAVEQKEEVEEDIEPVSEMEVQGVTNESTEAQLDVLSLPSSAIVEETVEFEAGQSVTTESVVEMEAHELREAPPAVSKTPRGISADQDAEMEASTISKGPSSAPSKGDVDHRVEDRVTQDSPEAPPVVFTVLDDIAMDHVADIGAHRMELEKVPEVQSTSVEVATVENGLKVQGVTTQAVAKIETQGLIMVTPSDISTVPNSANEDSPMREINILPDNTTKDALETKLTEVAPSTNVAAHGGNTENVISAIQESSAPRAGSVESFSKEPEAEFATHSITSQDVQKKDLTSGEATVELKTEAPLLIKSLIPVSNSIDIKPPSAHQDSTIQLLTSTQADQSAELAVIDTTLLSTLPNTMVEASELAPAPTQTEDSTAVKEVTTGDVIKKPIPAEKVTSDHVAAQLVVSETKEMASRKEPTPAGTSGHFEATKYLISETTEATKLITGAKDVKTDPHVAAQDVTQNFMEIAPAEAPIASGEPGMGHSKVSSAQDATIEPMEITPADKPEMAHQEVLSDPVLPLQERTQVDVQCVTEQPGAPEVLPNNIEEHWANKPATLTQESSTELAPPLAHDVTFDLSTVQNKEPSQGSSMQEVSELQDVFKEPQECKTLRVQCDTPNIIPEPPSALQSVSTETGIERSTVDDTASLKVATTSQPKVPTENAKSMALGPTSITHDVPMEGTKPVEPVLDVPMDSVEETPNSSVEATETGQIVSVVPESVEDEPMDTTDDQGASSETVVPSIQSNSQLNSHEVMAKAPHLDAAVDESSQPVNGIAGHDSVAPQEIAQDGTESVKPVSQALQEEGQLLQDAPSGVAPSKGVLSFYAYPTQEAFLSELEISKYFSITYEPHVEIEGHIYIPVGVCYLEKNEKLCEDVLAYVPLDEDLSVFVEAVTAALSEKWGLNLANCRGQSLLTVGATAAQVKAAATLFSQTRPLAICTFNNSVSLNTWLARSCVEISDSYLWVESLLQWMTDDAQKLDRILKVVTSLYQDDEGKRSELSLRLGGNQWDRSHDTIDFTVDVLHAMIICLSEMKDENNAQTDSAQAANFLCILQNFELILILVVMKNILGLTKGLSQSLQGESLEMYQALTTLPSLISYLKDVTTSLDSHLHAWYQEAVLLSEKLQIGVDPNSQDSLILHYRDVVSKGAIEHSISEMSQLFSDRALSVLRCTQLVPQILFKVEGCCTDPDLFKVYRDDLPDWSSFQTELQTWREKWRDASSTLQPLPIGFLDTFKTVDAKTFPNIMTLLRLLMVLPCCKREDSIRPGKTSLVEFNQQKSLLELYPL